MKIRVNINTMLTNQLMYVNKGENKMRNLKNKLIIRVDGYPTEYPFTNINNINDLVFEEVYGLLSQEVDDVINVNLLDNLHVMMEGDTV